MLKERKLEIKPLYQSIWPTQYTYSRSIALLFWRKLKLGLSPGTYRSRVEYIVIIKHAHENFSRCCFYHFIFYYLLNFKYFYLQVNVGNGVIINTWLIDLPAVGTKLTIFTKNTYLLVNSHENITWSRLRPWEFITLNKTLYFIAFNILWLIYIFKYQTFPKTGNKLDQLEILWFWLNSRLQPKFILSPLSVNNFRSVLVSSITFPYE